MWWRAHSLSRIWVGVATLAIVILVASMIPVPPATPQTDPTGTVDTTTLLHIAGYATLAAGGVIAVARDGWPWRRRSRHVEIRAVAGVVALVALFGVGTELLQATIPWRTFAVAEIGLNAASATGGGLAAMWFYRPVE
ncbi:MAG: VanZ like family [uncultured archaeon A07HN63]|nr:MAG: VanZ like family [uncultured archaeon A07HN63]